MSMEEKLITAAENERDIKFGIDAIEGALRDLLQTNDKMKLEDMPAKVYQVYGKGSNDGYDSGLAEGIEQGKQAEYDRFWDAQLQNGNREDFEQAFNGPGWNNDTFAPNRILKPKNARYMFARNRISGSMKDLLTNCGSGLDTSECTRHDYMYYASSLITEIPHIDLSKSENTTAFLYDATGLLKAELTFSENTPIASNAFVCKSLIYLIVHGTIAKSIDLGRSTKLSRDSFYSVFAAMSLTVTGQTLTASRTAVNAAFTEEEWNTLTATRPNWTYVYTT